MEQTNGLALTDKENHYLTKLDKYLKRVYMNYISVGILLCTALFGVVVGIKFRTERGFFIALYFGTLSVYLFIASRIHERNYRIILKLKQRINELEGTSAAR